MIAQFGYQDGGGEFFITIDTGRCNGCGACVPACPAGVFELAENPYDPLTGGVIAVVRETQRNRLQSACAPCKPRSNRPPLPCQVVCRPGAITHSW